MKTGILSFLLAASLGANLLLLLRPSLPPAPGTPASPTVAPARPTPTAATAPGGPPVVAPAGAPAAAASAPRGLTWKPLAAPEDFRRFAEELRAAGFPPFLVHSAVAALYRERRLADSPLARVPFWQAAGTENLLAQQAFLRETEASIEAQFGDLARPSERLDAVTRARRYGPLAAEKVDAIAALERDYQDMQSDAMLATARTASLSAGDWSVVQQQINLLDSEKRTDLARILTPAELEDYELRHARPALAVARGVQDLPLDEAEFRALVQARRAYDAALPPFTERITPEQAQQRQALQAAHVEQARAILADDRFYSYLESIDPAYRTVARIRSSHPSVSPAALYQAYQLQNEVSQAMRSLVRSRPTPEELGARYAEWNARLDAVLGREAADAFRQLPQGRMFRAPVVRPAPAAPAPAPRG
jgi:hypothetical protein